MSQTSSTRITSWTHWFHQVIHLLSPEYLHTCAANEHIGGIEKSVWIIKEGVRCGFRYMTYRNFTTLITRSLVQDMLTCLNLFPSKNGISSDLVPVAILRGSPNLYYNKLKITFGAYVHIYIGITNRTKQRKVVTIAMRPANKKVWTIFHVASQWKQPHKYIRTELPIN